MVFTIKWLAKLWKQGQNSFICKCLNICTGWSWSSVAWVVDLLSSFIWKLALTSEEDIVFLFKLIQSKSRFSNTTCTVNGIVFKDHYLESLNTVEVIKSTHKIGSTWTGCTWLQEQFTKQGALMCRWRNIYMAIFFSKKTSLVNMQVLVYFTYKRWHNVYFPFQND